MQPRVALFTLSTVCVLGSANADDLTLPHTFEAGTPARAADVNANFTAVETSVDDNAAAIAANADAITGNQASTAANADAIAELDATMQSNQASTDQALQTLTQQVEDLSSSHEPICFDNAFPPGAQFRSRSTGVITNATIIRAEWASVDRPELKLYYYQRGGSPSGNPPPHVLVNLNEGLSTHPSYDAVCVTVAN